MGWTSQHATYYRNGIIDRKAEMDNYFKEENSANGKYHYKTLKSAMVGSTYYAAIEKINNETKEREVFALICLTSVNMSDYFNFSYKDMDETMGPNERKCPIGILNLLTPTDYQWANKWREDCRKYHTQRNELTKLDTHGKKGGKIGFTPKYDLGSGKKAGEEFVLFWMDSWGQRKKGFWTDGFYRYPKSLLQTGTVRIIEEE